MLDIVIPRNNEQEFIDMAKRLCYGGLIFLYETGSFTPMKAKFSSDQKIVINSGILANPKTAIRDSDKLKKLSRLVAVRSSPYDRTVIEGNAVDLIIAIETAEKKDYLHQRASAMNHVLAKRLHENKICAGISVSSILSSLNPSTLIGRIRQNLAIYEKYRVPVIIASFAENPSHMRSPHDLSSFFSLLGFSGVYKNHSHTSTQFT